MGYDEIVYMMKEFSIEDEVIIPGWIIEEDLPYVYTGAEAFIFPSHYEGCVPNPLGTFSTISWSTGGYRHSYWLTSHQATPNSTAISATFFAASLSDMPRVS